MISNNKLIYKSKLLAKEVCGYNILILILQTWMWPDYIFQFSWPLLVQLTATFRYITQRWFITQSVIPQFTFRTPFETSGVQFTRKVSVRGYVTSYVLCNILGILTYTCPLNKGYSLMTLLLIMSIVMVTWLCMTKLIKIVSILVM